MMASPRTLRGAVLSFAIVLAGLCAAVVVGDWLLQRLGVGWLARYLGVAGTVLIVVSFAYSLRKRKLIHGDMRTLLALHETLTWLGALLVLMHAGMRVNAVLPWLALGAMVATVLSGLTGKFLLDRARGRILSRRENLQLRSMPRADVERLVFLDAVVLGVMTRWRTVHLPITLAFAGLALGHVVVALLFWSPR